MVVIGGITRLTDSGLSMVDWSLVKGAIPPLNQTDWIELFNKYKQTPEFQKINSDYTLKDFKFIFFWEYLHRMIGRLLGVVFILPFLYFLIKKRLNKKLIQQSLVLFSLGALQATIGWWMVKSGLVGRPDVSHYRLAVHLTTAFLTCSYTLWVALPLILKKKNIGNHKVLRYLMFLSLIVIIQIIYGAFVAGLKAGEAFPTWPKMGEEFIPREVFSSNPQWNFLNGMFGVQFIHRILAIFIVIISIFIYYKTKFLKLEYIQKISLKIIFSLIFIQFVLGVFTLIYSVPISLAILHQLGAFFLLLSIVYALFVFKID
tara:strand:+ start:3886 stop:4833 length:948 start_codon:yes stop_codon:yes gene_type:complete